MTFRNDRKELRKGEKLVVTIEDVLHNTLLVFLEYRKMKFCGVLLNTSNRRGPYGIEEQPVDSYYKSYGIDPTKLNAGDELEIEKAKDVPPPKFPETLDTRTTYGQEIDYPPPRQIYQRRRRSKRKVRMDMMDTDLALKLLTENSGRKLLSHPPSCCCDSCASGGLKKLGVEKSLKGKRKLLADTKKTDHKRKAKGGGWVDGVKELPKDSKRIKLDKNAVEKNSKKAGKPGSTPPIKRSPIIKISYKSPGGKGQVLKIPSRLHSPSPTKKNMYHKKNSMHERARKVVIRAKTEHFKYLKEHNDGSDSSKPEVKNPNGVKIKKVKNSRKAPGVKGKQTTEVNSAKHKSASPKKSSTVDTTAMPPFLKNSLKPESCVEPKSVAKAEISHPEKAKEADSEEIVDVVADEKISPTTQRKRQLRNLPQVLIQPLTADKSEDAPTTTDSKKAAESSSTTPEKTAKTADLKKVTMSPDDIDDTSGASGSHKKKDSAASHSISVTRCTTKEGVQWCQGDVVWGKIMGFPWWPGILRKIVVKKAEGVIEQVAIVDWFQSKTVSHIPCNNLESFSGNFKRRFSKRIKGNYKKAIHEAREAEKNMSPEVRKLIVQFET